MQVETDKPRLYRLAAAYAVIVWAVIAYLNYVLPYDPNTPTKFDLELANGGILTLPFVLAIFAIGILVGSLRDENMIGNLLRPSQ